MPQVAVPISSVTVEDWFHGLYTSFVFVTLFVIFSAKRYGATDKLRLTSFVILPYICSTMHASLNWVYYSSAVDSSEHPNGPNVAEALSMISIWIDGTGDTFFCLNVLIADVIFIWRCWTVWGRRFIVIVLPMLATFVGVVLGGFVIAYRILAIKSKEPFTAIKNANLFVKYTTIYFTLSIVTSLLTTLLITARISYVRRGSITAGLSIPKANRYRGAIEILVESAALYSASLLTFVITLQTKSSAEYYAQNIFAQMAGLAPLLIILRVAAGHSRSDREWDTSIQTNVGGLPTFVSATNQGSHNMPTTHTHLDSTLAATSNADSYMSEAGSLDRKQDMEHV